VSIPQLPSGKPLFNEGGEQLPLNHEDRGMMQNVEVQIPSSRGGIVNQNHGAHWSVVTDLAETSSEKALPPVVRGRFLLGCGEASCTAGRSDRR